MEKIYDVLNQSSLSYEEKLKIGSVILEEYFKEKEKMLTEKVTNNKITWGKSKVEMTWDEAKKWCEEQGGRLPKLWELLKAFEDKEEGFTSNYYWSSTETSTTTAYNVGFSNGATDDNYKTYSYYVRCIFDK